MWENSVISKKKKQEKKGNKTKINKSAFVYGMISMCVSLSIVTNLKPQTYV